jgi:probable rRNA maturation factor
VIRLENLNPKRKVDLSSLKVSASMAARHVWKGRAEVNIVLVSNQKIRALNRRYLGEDRATDVMAFPCGKSEKFMRFKLSPRSAFRGDIAISSDKAVENAKIYGTSILDELKRYVIHGVLHLAGFEDHSRADRDIMRRKEDEILEKTKKNI